MPRITTAYDEDIIARLKVVAARLAQPGVQVTLSDAVRVAVLRGAPLLEQELGITRTEARK